MCISQALFRSHSMISGFSWARSFSSWWKLEFSSDFVSVLQSPPLNGKARRAKYPRLDRIERKIFLFLLFPNACRSDSKSPISPIIVVEILRLIWTIWYVYKDLIWRAEFLSCQLLLSIHFHFRVVLWIGLFLQLHQALCGFTHDKSVPYLFSTPQARSQQQTEIHLSKKLAPVNDISGVLHLVDPMWIFSPRIW